MFVHNFTAHQMRMVALIDSENFEGKAITVGYPNETLSKNKNYKRHPFEPDLKDVSYI